MHLGVFDVHTLVLLVTYLGGVFVERTLVFLSICRSVVMFLLRVPWSF